MGAPDHMISYSSISNGKEDGAKVRYNDDDYDDDGSWSKEEGKSMKNASPFCYPDLSEDFFGGGYDSGDDVSQHDVRQRSNMPPEVNLKNVLTGLFAIVTGQNKSDGRSEVKQLPAPDVTFLGSKKNGDTYLHSSVYTPSAPPLFEPSAIDYSAYKEVLEAEPPEWLRDSSAKACMQCDAPFTAITRGRHHCRFCGGIFCRLCSKGRCLLPVKFRERNPQRVCDACYDRLDPLQGVLINTISNATQVAKHDVMDWTSARGWLNLPVGLSLEHEIYKAAITLKNFCQVSRLNPERSIPSAVLKGAKGLAILTVAKAGALVTYKLGTGLVVVRKADRSWSAPSAICSVGLGWGAQIGVELTDFIIVLRDMEAVKTFCSRMHFSLGAGCSAAAGPVGRVVEADLRAGDKGSGMCYTYSCSKGAFVGVSLEGNVVATRMDANLRFYGDPYLTTHDILLGNVEPPRAGEPLYAALDELHAKIRY